MCYRFFRWIKMCVLRTNQQIHAYNINWKKRKRKSKIQQKCTWLSITRLADPITVLYPSLKKKLCFWHRCSAWPHGVQLSAQPSTPVPRRPRPVCPQYRLQTTSSLCQPRSSRRASPSSQQLWSAGFFCGRLCDMELVTRQSKRSGHQQRLLQAFTEDVFIFSLLVYIAH